MNIQRRSTQGCGGLPFQQGGTSNPLIERLKSPPSAGYTLTEALITVVIIGILTTLALPSYLQQLYRSRQGEASTMMSQILASIAAYNDEYGMPPETWEDLSLLTAVMTSEGPAGSSNGSLSDPINLPGNHYQLQKSNQATNGYFELEAETVNQSAAQYNVLACVNLRTGSSSVLQGRANQAAIKTNLKC